MLGWHDKRPLSLVISPSRARRLADKSGLSTIEDALLNFPLRYVRAGSTDALVPMVEGQMYSCVAEILHIQEKTNFSGKGPSSFVSFHFSDGTAEMDSALFGYPAAHLAALTPGTIALLHGKLSRFRNTWQLRNPSYVTIRPGEKGSFGAFGLLKTIVDIAGSGSAAQKLVQRPWLPSYPRRPGTSTAEMIGVMDKVLAAVDDAAEMLPEASALGAPAWPKDAHGAELMGFGQALREIHQPPPHGPAAAQQRLKFQEALQLQVVMALRRVDAAQRRGMAMPMVGDGLVQEVAGALPFALSPGQQRAWEEISMALASTTPAQLLLHGDVGSGKTVVALLAMLQAVDAGYQCALIAPTEVLAVQHARTLNTVLAGTSVQVTLLTGSQKTAQRRQNLLNIVSGESQIVVGTHALIQDAVEFHRLGFVVVDEQHRFGVRQRDKLRENAAGDRSAHMLVMTATPIPRTVAMTLFGDLTVVRLDGVLHGRGSVQCTVVPAHKDAWVRRIWQRMGEEVRGGSQVYVVVPRVEGEDGVYAWAARIAEVELPQVRVGVLHGQMEAEEKDAVMTAFHAGDLDVLVATTVIEVGVDVPNATMILIVDAERFGVAQLHQMRGRVGRGSKDAVCLLLTDAEEGSASFQRLEAVAATHDGFALAELDLQQRAEGDILGEDQSGARTRRVRLLDLSSDGHLIEEARRYAGQLVAFDEALARHLVEGLDSEEQNYIERS